MEKSSIYLYMLKFFGSASQREYKTVIRYQFVNICPQYPCILLDSRKGLPCSMYPFKLLDVVLPRYFILFFLKTDSKIYCDIILLSR